MRSIKTNRSSNRTANKLKNSRTNNEVVPFQRPWRKREPLITNSKRSATKTQYQFSLKKKSNARIRFERVWETERVRETERAIEWEKQQKGSIAIEEEDLREFEKLR